MISQVNTSLSKSVINEPMQKPKSETEMINVSKQGDSSQVEKLKASIEDGSYIVDLRALAEKIVKDLV